MKAGILAICLGVLIITGAVAFAFHQSKEAQSQTTACTLEGKTCPDGTVVGRQGPNCEFAACPTDTAMSGSSGGFSWRFEVTESAEADSGVPETQVFLTHDNREYHMGRYDGTCAAIAESNWTPLEGEQGGVVCWFGGGGTEIGIFLEHDRFVVKRGTLEEGTAETPGSRGELASIYTLP